MQCARIDVKHKGVIPMLFMGNVETTSHQIKSVPRIKKKKSEEEAKRDISVAVPPLSGHTCPPGDLFYLVLFVILQMVKWYLILMTHDISFPFIKFHLKLRPIIANNAFKIDGIYNSFRSCFLEEAHWRALQETTKRPALWTSPKLKAHKNPQFLRLPRL